MNEKVIMVLKVLSFLVKAAVIILFTVVITSLIWDEVRHNPREGIRKEYGEVSFFDNNTFISDGKLYKCKYDTDGQLHVFYVDDVTEKVVTEK